MKTEKPKEYYSIKWKKKNHFINRLMERFGIRVDDFDVDDIIEDIHSFSNKPINILDSGNSFHLFNIQGSDIIILYDWEYEIPLTVYFKKWFKKISDTEYEFKPQLKQKHLKIYNKAQTFSSKTGIVNNHVWD